MKKLLFIILTFITLTSIYYDLSVGTLPAKSNSSVEAAEKSELAHNANEPKKEHESPSTLSYQEVIVEPGYTVLSIVEHLHTGPISASIQEVIFDFQELNPGVSAEKIQIGQTYLFPLYQE
ncbi:hypothetical protein AB990_12105 [Alkalihalobacillus pseudalcaliphilus]|nr:hypothetical protein AB990_12105 [Alkalihalobacillus pseudalcaliphilus]